MCTKVAPGLLGLLCSAECAQHFMVVASLINGTIRLLVLLYSAVSAAFSGYCESEK